MAAEKPSWLQQPLRVLDLVYNARMNEMPMTEVVRICRRMHANVIHFHCQYNMGGGFDEEGMYFRSRLAKRQNRDVLAEFLPLAKKAGIRTVVYANLHWFTKPFADQHPDWWVIKHDGSRLENLYGGDDSSFCINTPWRDWSFVLLEDLCRYPIDGVFFDGPISFLSRGCCYCPHCRRLFNERHGRDMPPPERSDREEYSLLRRSAVDSMDRYYRDAMEVLHRTRPGVVGYGNCANAAEPDWAAGRVNRRMVPLTDVLAAEGGFMYGRAAKAILKTGASSRVYETQAAGKPSINAVSMAFSPWRWVSLSAAETSVLLSEASVGVNPYYAIFLQGIEMPGIAAAAEVYGFLSRQAKYYRGSVSAAAVGLVQSGQTLSGYSGVDIPWADIGSQHARRAEAVGNHSRALYGFHEMLLRARIPFDILDEVRLEEAGLDRYAGIVLPNAACLSDGQCRALTEYVRQGGTVVADFETSHYDELGRRRREFGLTELFGVCSENEVSPLRRWDYVLTPERRPGPLSELPVDFLPAPRHSLRVTPTAGQVHAVFSEPLASNIVASATPSDQPFLVENRVGRGVCWYLPATFGEFFEEARPEAYPAILGAMLGSAAKPLRVSGPPHLLDLHLRQQPSRRRVLVHLVNLELGPISEVVPAYKVGIEVRVPFPVRSVIALRADRSLRFRQRAGKVSLVLPELREYEVVALEGLS
ncbi:MAG: alpha-amylase family protein [Candidatus Latescibacterota bacterium]